MVKVSGKFLSIGSTQDSLSSDFAIFEDVLLRNL